MSEKLKPGWTIPVLDKGYVRYIDHMGTDSRIVEAARISYKSPSKGEVADNKLISYLYKNKHSSPFEMVKVTLNIKLPIFVMRQYIRHRMQNCNEVSARYTELPDEFYFPPNWRRQDIKNKQGSIINDEIFNPTIDILNDINATDALICHCEVSYNLYKSMIESGISREMARMVLPVNIYTEIYACWDLKNLLHFITLREDSHAQSEIQQYAVAIKTILSEICPVTMKCYEKYKWNLAENEPVEL
jgi:thymidylate synthase (FAD)